MQRRTYLLLGGLAVVAVVLAAFVSEGLAGWRLLGPTAMIQRLLLRLLGYVEGMVMQPSWVVIIGAIVLLAVWRMRRERGVATRSDIARAMDMLRARYDRGDITPEQYEQLRREFEG